MDTQSTRRRPLPNVRFRVLIAGRANAGKTSILQRVCETTQSPEIYRVKVTEGKETREQIHLDPTSERGQHDISDELVFTNHKGYVFHDSRGFESGSENELQIIQDFVRDRSQRKRLQERLHAIWFCIPMDKQRPSLDVAPFHNICPDKNVPMIAVFTKYEAFRRNVQLDLEDDENNAHNDLQGQTSRESQRIFETQYLSGLGEAPKFVRLEGMHQSDGHCDDLIRTTMDALNPGVVALMLLAVQTKNLELSVQLAVKRGLAKVAAEESVTKELVRECLGVFPAFWWNDDFAAAFFFVANLDADVDFLFDPDFDDDPAFDDVKNIPHSLITFANEVVALSNSTNRTNFLMIVTIIVLRHVTLLYLNTSIKREDALQQAYGEYLDSDICVKVDQWLTASPVCTEQQIVDFILGSHF